MKIERTVELPINATEAWELLKQTDTLLYVARGVMSYGNAGDLAATWETGNKIDLQPRLLDLLPLGSHLVTVVKVNEDSFTIVTHEKGENITRWEHTMNIKPTSDGGCTYTDSVEIECKSNAFLTQQFVKFFYGHRQRRLKKLAAAYKNKK